MYCKIIAEQLLKLETLEKLLECRVCCDPLDNPKTLCCQHSFCKYCTDKLLVFNEDGSAYITCPTCRAVSTLTSSQTTNDLQVPFTFLEILDHVIEIRKEQSPTCEFGESCRSGIICWCKGCKKHFCNDCFRNHECKDKFAVVGHFNNYSKEFKPTCIQHNALITHLCLCENGMICDYCKHRDHKTHQTVILDDLANSLKQNFLEKLNMAEQRCFEKKFSYKEATRRAEEFKSKLIFELDSRIVQGVKKYIENMFQQKKMIVEQCESAFKEWTECLEDHGLLHQDLQGALNDSIEELKHKKSFRVVTDYKEITRRNDIVTHLRCLQVSLTESTHNGIGQLHCTNVQSEIMGEKVTADDIFEGAIIESKKEIENKAAIIKKVTEDFAKIM